MPRFAKKATRIATVSEYSRQDIVKLYGINPDKIDVVYNGAKDVYRPLNADTILATRQKYTAGKPYFIYVGSIHPRKNIKNLLLAFEAFKTGTQSDFKLVLAGRKAWDYQEVEVVYNALLHKNDVIFTGHIPPEELAAITGAAHAMVYVSLFEGFGIPVIEAMSSHVPVITSNVTSMPEAAGDAALLVNPGSVTEISSAMQKIASDDTLRSLLIEKGSVQLKKFSWALTAQKLWQCCEKALLNQ
jgi:glycosyltransferase involved in cell wall biosynthesis